MYILEKLAFPKKEISLNGFELTIILNKTVIIYIRHIKTLLLNTIN